MECNSVAKSTRTVERECGRMREIRFRAWDTTKKKMHHEISLMFANDLNGVFEGLNECDCIVMQYTGLKDKNGKEIYEGDIVDDSETELIYVIEFICGEFVGINEECGIGRIMNSLSEDGEVIGNIHDNPELLEKGE